MAGPSYYNGAGLEIDCDGNLWAVAQSERKVYQFESGEAANLCEAGKDAPWLTEDPQEGIVAADNTYPIELTFTAFPTMTIDSFYTGTLIIKSDDPVSDTFRVPVTMTVIAPVIEVGVLPTDITQTGLPGTVVYYEVTVSNLGNVPDSYEISLAGQFWPILLVDDQVSLGIGESAQVSLFVFIPTTAEDGDQDVMTLKATSHLRAGVSASSQLTTIAQLPPIARIPRLYPSEVSLIGALGEMVEYELTLWNYSMVTDTIILSADSIWSVNLPETSFTLGSFEYADLIVQVFVPFDADIGAMDVAVITATSQGDPTAMDTTRLFTNAAIGHFYMPMISR